MALKIITNYMPFVFHVHIFALKLDKLTTAMPILKK